jgi:hypothetical protein
MMTKTRFRAIYTLSMCLAIASLATSCAGESSLPPQLQEYLANLASTEPSAVEWALLAMVVPFLVACIVSFVGMLRFKSWSRPLTVATTAIGTLLLPFFGPTVEPSVSTSLNYASSMLYGAVVALAYYSPAAVWFQEQPARAKPLQRTSSANPSS